MYVCMYVLYVCMYVCMNVGRYADVCKFVSCVGYAPCPNGCVFNVRIYTYICRSCGLCMQAECIFIRLYPHLSMFTAWTSWRAPWEVSVRWLSAITAILSSDKSCSYLLALRDYGLMFVSCEFQLD